MKKRLSYILLVIITGLICFSAAMSHTQAQQKSLGRIICVSAGDGPSISTFGGVTGHRKIMGGDEEEEGDTCCAVVDSILAFGEIAVGVSDTDSFFVYNCGDSAFADSIDWDLSSVYALLSDSIYALDAGDTAWFYVRFTPVASASYPDTIDTGASICSDVVVSGTGTVESCIPVLSGITYYDGLNGGQDTKAVWTTDLVANGQMKWDETGETDWNYELESGDDSLTHYVQATDMGGDYAQFDMSVRSWVDECADTSEWSTSETVYGPCAGRSLASYSAEWGLMTGNMLKATPNNKAKIKFRWQKFAPTEGDPEESAYIGNYDTNLKYIDQLDLDRNADYYWWVYIQDPCLDVTYLYIGEFTTDSTGKIQ